ncbi:MAG: CsgG/HfaB family protein [Thermoanaerobaculia bacterium]
MTSRHRTPPEPRRPSPGRRAAACAVAAALAAFAPAAAYQHQLEALADRLARDLPTGDLAAVAVVDFTDLRGEPTELGRFLAEELSTALVQAAEEPGSATGSLRVIDRLRLGRVLDELELAATGLLDPADARRVGEVAGVDGLVTGNLVPFADAVRINVKLLDVRTGEILLTDTADLPRTPTLTDLEERPLTVRVPPGIGEPLELSVDGPPRQTVHFQELEIALRGCVRVEAAVHCLFTATHHDADTTLYVYGNTRAVLPDGTTVPVSRLHLGGRTASGPHSRVGARLARGIPTTGSAVFEEVPPGADTLRRLELDLHGDDARFLRVPIRRP